MVKVENITENEIDYLINPVNSFSLSCMVKTPAVSGKRLIKAGTPLYITTGKNVYKDRDVVLSTDSDGGDLVGIARHTVSNDKFDTDGTANDAVLLQGYVEFYRLDEEIQSTIENGIEAKLTNIKFVRGAK